MCERTYDYSKLRGRVREMFRTQEIFAKAINISSVSVSNKLNNLVDWKQEEIERAVYALRIPPEDIHLYFFTKKVEKNSIYKEKEDA